MSDSVKENNNLEDSRRDTSELGLYGYEVKSSSDEDSDLSEPVENTREVISQIYKSMSQLIEALSLDNQLLNTSIQEIKKELSQIQGLNLAGRLNQLDAMREQQVSIRNSTLSTMEMNLRTIRKELSEVQTMKAWVKQQAEFNAQLEARMTTRLNQLSARLDAQAIQSIVQPTTQPTVQPLEPVVQSPEQPKATQIHSETQTVELTVQPLELTVQPLEPTVQPLEPTIQSSETTPTQQPNTDDCVPVVQPREDNVLTL